MYLIQFLSSFMKGLSPWCSNTKHVAVSHSSVQKSAAKWLFSSLAVWVMTGS